MRLAKARRNIVANSLSRPPIPMSSNLGSLLLEAAVAGRQTRPHC